MKAIIYRVSDGRVVGFKDCLEQDVQNSLAEGCSYLEVTEDILAPELKYKHVLNGILQDLPSEQKEAEVLATEWKRLKKARKTLLNQSDWTQVPDEPVESAAWAVYRQQLRDLPANTTDPRNVEWPVPPS